MSFLSVFNVEFCMEILRILDSLHSLNNGCDYILSVMDNNCSGYNRNASNFLHRIRNRVVTTNLVTPEIFISEVWMRDGSTSGVEIIELNSNSLAEQSSQESINQEQPSNINGAGSIVKQNNVQDELRYEINKGARERRRMQHELKYANEFSDENDNNFNGFRYLGKSHASEIQHGPQMNCFTIINNHDIHSGSSTPEQDNDRIEELESYFVDNNDDSPRSYWDHVYNENMVAYDNKTPNKRTVSIYSFKNKRRLSENDYGLVNIPSKDSTETSSNSLSDEEYEKYSNVNRTASPIPASYIPRLDLSLAQTLSTVTEVSEIKSNESLSKKPINNWLTVKVEEVIPDVVKSMDLSPQERRRRFKNTATGVYPSNQHVKGFTYTEGSTPKHASTITVDVQIYTTEEVSLNKTDLDKISVKIDLHRDQSKETKPDIIHPEVDIENENTEEIFSENKKPCINIFSNKTYNVMTEPMDILNSDRWIGNDNEHDETLDYIVARDIPNGNDISFRDNGDDLSDTASRRLSSKRALLMKSPKWDHYLPVTGTPPSISLSLSISSIESKRSWFKRISKFLKCCK